MNRGWTAISALLVPLLLLGCSFPPSGLEQQIRLESTVMAMQTDVAVELAELRELISTPVMPPTSTPSPTSPPLIPTATPTGALTSLDGTVATDILNMRSGPSLEYDVIGHLQKGDELQIRARTETGDWVKVSTDAGLEGWVALEYVALNVPLEGIPLAVEIPPTPTPGPTVHVTPTVPPAPTATPVSSAEG